MSEEQRARIQARLAEMTCRRASDPLTSRLLCAGWGENQDGTKTLWRVAPGPTLVEEVTIRSDTDPSDFEQLQVMLEV